MKTYFNYKKLIFLLILMEVSNLYGQTTVTLNEAINRAFQNNISIKNAELRKEQQEKLKKAYAVVDPLEINGEIGQFNSEKTDNKISVSQNIKLPGFYKKQKQVYIEELKKADLNIHLNQWQLKKEIALAYNELLYLINKKKLLEQTDSIFSNYLKKAELRLKKGESNILEKTTADNYRAQAKIQLVQLQSDFEIKLDYFNFLIQDKERLIPDKNDVSVSYAPNFQQTYEGNTKIVQILEQDKNIEMAKLNAEKSKLLPSFNLGINSTTIAGTSNSDNRRFQSGIIGIVLPLFNSAQKSVIEAQKINQLIIAQQINLEKKKMKNQYSTLVHEYHKLQTEQTFYNQQGLKNADTIISTANRLFYEGEINYLEWAMLMNQSLEIKNKWIDNQKLLNEKSIEINALNEQ